MQYNCEIDKIINDEGVISYQIYYYHETDDDWRLDVPFRLTKKQRKNHFETTEDLEETIKLIISYKCTLVAFYNSTEGVKYDKKAFKRKRNNNN